jgi:acyl-CoA reductase-like NAD-dependent aldehyde dehydrogenase
MLQAQFPLYLAGQPATPNTELAVTNKHTLEPATRVAKADRAMVVQAIDAAVDAFDQTRKLPSYQRQAMLQQIVDRVNARHEELARILAIEAGKPIKFARGEVTRLVDTFRLAAEEATRIYGEWQPLDISERAAGYEGIVRRFPLGPCSLITPFNFPLNLVAHKVAPAIAAGCPWVLKPASATPVSALILAEIIAETDWPKPAFSVLPCASKDVEPMVTDERIKLLSFTGSAEIGWRLKANAGRKRVSLELGGNAACIVDRDADLELAADRITLGAFYQSGQSCISVQRVIIHRDVYDELKTLLVERANALKIGDPLDEDTFIGPLITVADAERVESWVNEAVSAGATIACGGTRNGAHYAATYLENVDPSQKVSCDEVFGPVATLQPFDDIKDAVRIADDSEFGLQAGIFTRNLDHAFYAYNELDVGGVVVNDMPSFRVDSMPYGGTKQSGNAREGLRYAIEEMTERKLMVLKNAGKL